MRKLIFANMTRLRKNKLFWAGIVISMAYSVFLLIMNYLEMLISPEAEIMPLNWYFLSAVSVAGIFCAVFCGLFIGTEYNDGTMRNKLIAGHKRTDIYLANVIIIFLAEVIISLVACIVVLIIGIPLFGCYFVYPMRFALNIFCGILMLGAFAGVFSLIAMLSSNKATSATACMITYVLLFVIGNLLRVKVFSNYGMMPSVNASDETLRLVMEFLYDFLPTGQSFQISSGVILHPYRFPLYAIINIGLTTVCGLAIFKKKDLK